MGGGLFDNLSPYDMYGPSPRSGVRNGALFSWPRSPLTMDPNGELFREPGFHKNNNNAATRPSQWNDRSTSVGASPVRSASQARSSSSPSSSSSAAAAAAAAVEGSERTSSPVVRKVRTIPVQDGRNSSSNEALPQRIFNKAPVHTVVEEEEAAKERFACGNGDDVSASSLRKRSSALDAATAVSLIQSAYRGYVVRRTEPLKHLRIISKARSELKELVSRAAEPEPAQFDKLRRDGLERLKWNEVIMAMLLRLDSIQGAHPVVRDIRKSVAKEVVQFQEIVDEALDSHDGEEETADGRRQNLENGDDDMKKASSDAILDGEITPELNEEETEELVSSAARDGETAAAHVQELEKGENLEHMDIAGSTAADHKSHADEDVHPQQQANFGEDELSSQSMCIADTEMADTVEGIPSENVLGFVLQPPQAAASTGLPETAAHLNLHVNNITGESECGEDAVAAASGASVKSACDDAMAAEEVFSRARVSSGPEDLVMEECPDGGGSPSLLATAKDSERDGAECEKMKDDVSSQLKDVEGRQPKAHHIDDDDSMELKVNVQEEVPVNMLQEVATGPSQLEEAGSSGRRTTEVVASPEPETSGSSFPVMEEPSDHQDELSRNGKSSGILEEEMDVGNNEPAASLVTADLEQDVSVGAMMCDECGRPDRSTEVMLANGDAPDSNHEIELLGQEGIAGAAEGEADHGKRDTASSAVPCLWLETPQVSAHGDRIKAIPGDLARVATEVGDTWTLTAIISPDLMSLGEVTGLSDRALMQNLLEENRKLKAAIGEVLQWGKQQSDIIHNLATRIEQLEAKVSDSNLLKNGTNVFKKRSKAVGALPRDTLSAGEEVESICRLPRSGRFGRRHGRHRLHHLEDGHWSSSAESEEFF